VETQLVRVAVYHAGVDDDFGASDFAGVVADREGHRTGYVPGELKAWGRRLTTAEANPEAIATAPEASRHGDHRRNHTRREDDEMKTNRRWA
jgi:hypothetical protein